MNPKKSFWAWIITKIINIPSRIQKNKERITAWFVGILIALYAVGMLFGGVSLIADYMSGIAKITALFLGIVLWLCIPLPFLYIYWMEDVRQ